MVRSVRIYRNNEFILLPLEEYLVEYNSQLPEGWKFYCDWLDRVFNINTELEYDNLTREIQVGHFDISKVRESYISLKNNYTIFDDDILKFIAFLFGTNYFLKIGNPSIEQWFKSKDINHPFKELKSDDSDFSFYEVIQYRFGQNAIRQRLLSTLKWITSQSGS